MAGPPSVVHVFVLPSEHKVQVFECVNCDALVRPPPISLFFGEFGLCLQILSDDLPVEVRPSSGGVRIVVRSPVPQAVAWALLRDLHRHFVRDLV